MSLPPEGELNVDFDRLTGKTIWGWSAVRQAITELILTATGERVQREWIGSDIMQLLGENLTEETVLRAYTGLAMILDVHEPRFRLRQFLTAQSSRRTGELRLRMEGDYLPLALAGDMTPAAAVTFDEAAR